MFYGMGTSIPGMPYMAHKNGFTASGLKDSVSSGGLSQWEYGGEILMFMPKGIKNLSWDDRQMMRLG